MYVGSNSIFTLNVLTYTSLAIINAVPVGTYLYNWSILVETVNTSGSQLTVAVQYNGTTTDIISVWVPYGPGSSKVLAQSFSGVITNTTPSNVLLRAFSNNATMYVEKLFLSLPPTI